MASLVKNGSNYGLVWTDKNKSPRQVRESLKTDDRIKAISKKKELEWAFLNGEHNPWKRKWYEAKKETTGGVDTSNAIEQFISYKSSSKGREGWSDTVTQRETYVMRNFAKIIGPKPINEITKKDLEDFYYRKSVNSDHTRNGDYISVNTFLNWCKEKGFIDSKPKYRPKKPQSKIPKFITPKVLREMIDHRIEKYIQDLKGSRLKNLPSTPPPPAWVVFGWMILAGTGMRPDELSNITIHDVSESSIIIGQSFTTKVRAERRVPLLYEAQQAVETLMDPKIRSLDPSLDNSKLLLGRKPTYAKKKLSSEFSATWKDLYPDIPKKTLYNLKNTFAVRFLCDESLSNAAGIRLLELKEILGHSSLETTQRYLQAVPFGTKVSGTIWDYVREKR